MPAAVPIIAVVAAGAVSAAVGGGIIGALAAAGTAIVVSAIGRSVLPAPKPKLPALNLAAPGAGRTQSLRQPITEHRIVLGRAKVSGPIVFLHSATDDEGREHGFFHMVVVLAAHRVRAIGTAYLGDKLETDEGFAGLVRIDRHLGDADQAADANLLAEIPKKWTADHRGRGRAYLAVRLKLKAAVFPSGPPNVSAIVDGADTILDPRTGTTGWSDNAALCLAWYLTAPFGWRAAWSDIDLPSLIAAANVCDELVGTRAGVHERRYTVNGTLSLAEGKIEITRKLVAAMAGALVVSGGRFFIHAGAPALPTATLRGDDLRGDVTIASARPRRDLFNGVRAVYVDPAKNWQPTDAPPLLASNYVAEDGGEAIFRDLEFPLTTSVSTVQRLMKIELERNRRQRSVLFPARLSALRLRPWDGVTVALDRMPSFPARVTGWSLAPKGGVDLALAEEDPAVWDWDASVDERAAGDSPSVVLPNPSIIAAPASIAVATPQGVVFAALGVSWEAVGSAYLAGYELEVQPQGNVLWQGFAAGLAATSAAVPTSVPTAFRVRARSTSGAVSAWRTAGIPALVASPSADGIAGGIRIDGGFPADAVKLHLFEAAADDLGSAVKLPEEPTALPFDRTGLGTGDERWYWLRSVSAEGNVSGFAGPITATAL